MDILRKKHDSLKKLITLEESSIEKTRQEFVQLKTLLDKAVHKEKMIKDSIFCVENKSRDEMLNFDSGTIDKITQYRIFVEKKNMELVRQSCEKEKIKELFDKVSHVMNKKLLKIRKLENKSSDMVLLINLEDDKKNSKLFDEMWLQRLSRSTR